MSSIFRKNFHLCFAKIRCLPTSLSPPLTLDDDDDDNDETQAYLPPLIVSTEKSTYDNPSPSSPSTVATISLVDDDLSSSLSSFSSDEYADLSAILASQRLIVSSPGYSNSILESLSSSSGDGDNHRKLVGGVPINKYSPNPYADFRRSMQEMVEAKQRELKKKYQQEAIQLPLKAEVNQSNESNNNDELLGYLQELLLCYLNLNPKHTHKFIIGAFADILVSLMSTHGFV